jgi:ribonucleoside-diphosphate reductase alpha chain
VSTLQLIAEHAPKTSNTTKPLTRQEAYDNCIKAVKDELAAKVLVDKYFLCNNGIYYESTPAQMWDRLATAIATAEAPDKQPELVEQFRHTLDDFKFVPAGRVLYGLGNPYVNVTLKNCYVIAVREDSIKGIFQTAYEMAETYKAGGGCGIDISALRPRGSVVHNAARESTGAVSFMDFYSHITGMIGQKARIGALLISIDVSHPDVEDFISIKGGDDLDLVRYANVSVKITDEFMRAVNDNKDFDLRWDGKVYKTIKARELWNKLIHYAWKRAEPGLLFWDKTCREIPAHNYPGFACVTTNPCGETSLSDGDSCNLGSMNLGKYVINPFKKPEFDFDTFENDTHVAVRFLDNIISLEKAPLPFQQRANDNGRRLGLGVMGFADMLLKMNIRYDSDQALALTDRVMNSFMRASYSASCNLAEEKGPFPIFSSEIHAKSEFIKRLPNDIKERINKTGIRNIAVHAIAPTGSLSCIAQCSSAIEPVFMMRHIRKTNLGTAKKVEEHEVFHSVAKQYVELTGEKLPDFFVSSHQISPDYRIKMQALVNKYIDQSISNTVNLPADTTEEKIAYYYMEAWRQGCKGITVYRDGSREGVLVSTEKRDESKEITIHSAPKRPSELDANVHVIKPNGKTYTIFVGLLQGRPYEVFALDHKQAGMADGMKGKIVKVSRDKPDGDNIYNFESGALLVRQLNRYEGSDVSLITRLISTSLRHGTPLEFLVDQTFKSKDPLTSFGRAIARALSSYVKKEDMEGKFKCPKCGGRSIKYEGMCFTCLDCAHSKCS